MYNDTADRGKPRLYIHDFFVSAHTPRLMSSDSRNISGMGMVFEPQIASPLELELGEWWALEAQIWTHAHPPQEHQLPACLPPLPRRTLLRI